MSKIGSGTTWAKLRARPAPDATVNSGTLRMGEVRSQALLTNLGRHVSKICGNVLHFLNERGLYVTESQRCKACSAKRSPASPTRAGGFQSHLVRRCRLETVPGVPTFRPSGRRRGSALAARPLHNQGQSAPRREADASQAPRGSSLYSDFRRLLYRTG